MDVWEDDFREPTEDERSARRMVAIAISLINARRPVTTKRLRRDFYPNMGDEAFRKAYQRDRKRLSAAGLTIVRNDLPTGEPAWEIDGAAAYADGDALTPEDALFLNCLLLPSASDPSFPYARDLHMALTKLDRSFTDPQVARIPPEARNRNRQLGIIETCMAHHHAARISYVRSDGTATQRTIVPWGLFPLRATTYMVGPRLVDDMLLEPHVYNLDRMQAVRELSGTTYHVPMDFDVLQYIRLPFQLGEYKYTATFAVPIIRMSDVRAAVADHGTWTVGGQGAPTVSIPVADEDAAAAWSIAEGIRPLSPPDLADAWRRRLVAVIGGKDPTEEEGA